MLKDRIRAGLELVLEKYKGIEVFGPFAIEEMSREQLTSLENFRSKYASMFSPYLLNGFTSSLDNVLQRQGTEVYFYAQMGNQLVGCVRLRGQPFELEFFLGEMGCYGAFADCVEFSRLMVEPSVRGMRAGQIIMAVAALWAMDQGFDGVVALCRSSTRKLFGRYGLTSGERAPVSIAERDCGEYFLMHGTWQDIASCATIDQTLEASKGRTSDLVCDSIRQIPTENEVNCGAFDYEKRPKTGEPVLSIGTANRRGLE